MEDKLRRQRAKRFEPMLDGLPQYSFEQRYYHSTGLKDKLNQSRSLYSIYDKLHRVLNVSKLSEQSFMQLPTPSNNLSKLEEKIGIIEKDARNKNQKPIAEDQKHFNFLKKGARNQGTLEQG